MEIHPVHLQDMSKAVMSKLRNGHSVRAALGAKGSGVPAFLTEGNIKKLMKAGKKGGKAVIKLGAEELAKNRASGSGIMAGGKLGGFKDFKKGFSKGFNAMGGVDGIVNAGEMMAGAGVNFHKFAKQHHGGAEIMSKAEGEGFMKDFKSGFSGTMHALGGPENAIKIGSTLAGAGVPKAKLASIASNIAKSAVKQISGGKLKMKSITGAISTIAKSPAVQKAALDVAKGAMGSGLAEGGKLKMKSITHAIGSVAKNPTVQKVAIDTLKGAMSGEGMFAGAKGGATLHKGPDGKWTADPMHTMGPRVKVGGSVKRKVVDLIEDIGENAPRKKGESRVRQAIDLVEKMRKPRGGAMTRSKAAAERKKHCHDAGYHLQECVKGKRGRKPAGGEGIWAGGSGIWAGGSGMFAGARGGAIGPHGEFSGITNVGAGGNLMCLSNPALRPQPRSENFFFHTQFPPALAKSIES